MVWTSEEVSEFCAVLGAKDTNLSREVLRSLWQSYKISRSKECSVVSYYCKRLYTIPITNNLIYKEGFYISLGG
jgi:hypothetical protein